MSSILKEDQYFDNEADFCRVFSSAALDELEDIFLANRISYFIKPGQRSLLSVFFLGSSQRTQYIVRINSRDIRRAIELVEGIRGIEVIADPPREDWSPKEKLRRLQEEKELARERARQEAEERAARMAAEYAAEQKDETEDSSGTEENSSEADSKADRKAVKDTEYRKKNGTAADGSDDASEDEE